MRSRGVDGGSGAERDLIEAGLSEPADAAVLWDLCCSTCSGRAALGEAVRRCGRRLCGAIDVGRGNRRAWVHAELGCGMTLPIGRWFNQVVGIGGHCIRRCRCRAAARPDARAIAYVHDVSGRGMQRGSVAVMRSAPPQQGQSVGSKRGSWRSGWMISLSALTGAGIAFTSNCRMVASLVRR